MIFVTRLFEHLNLPVCASPKTLKWVNLDPKPFNPNKSSNPEKVSFYNYKGQQREVLGKSPKINFKNEQISLLKDRKFEKGKKGRDKYISQLWSEKSYEEKIAYKDGRYTPLGDEAQTNVTSSEPADSSSAFESSTIHAGFELYKKEYLLENEEATDQEIQESYSYLSDLSKELYDEQAN